MENKVDESNRLIGGKEFQLFKPGCEAEESVQAWAKCQKNPGHVKFIPVSDFQMQHLPKELCNEDIFNWIKHSCNLTVRVRVGKTSIGRPQEDELYLSSGSKTRLGERGLVLGTGYIVCAKQTAGPCACDDGQFPLHSCEGPWSVIVWTAQHVVFDDYEAKNTTIDLYFDDEASKSDGRFKSVKGFTRVGGDSRKDWTAFECITHDSELGAQIAAQLNQWNELGDKIRKIDRAPNQLGGQNVVVISHPHGQPKYLTLGQAHTELTDLSWQYSYTADTCAGSSGAPVLGLCRGVPGLGWPLHGVHHCLGGDKDAGINYGFCTWLAATRGSSMSWKRHRCRHQLW